MEGESLRLRIVAAKAEIVSVRLLAACGKEPIVSPAGDLLDILIE